MNPGVAVFVFLSLGAIALFSFLSVTVWLDTRQKERKAYYEAEVLKKIAEQGGENNPALEYLREQERIVQRRRTAKIRLGGLVNIGVGLGVGALMLSLMPTKAMWTVGLIPLFIGLALVAHVTLLADKENADKEN